MMRARGRTSKMTVVLEVRRWIVRSYGLVGAAGSRCTSRTLPRSWWSCRNSACHPPRVIASMRIVRADLGELGPKDAPRAFMAKADVDRVSSEQDRDAVA